MEFDFKKNYILENKYIKIRSLEYSDFDKITQYTINEIKVLIYDFKGTSRSENLKKYIENALSNRKKESEYSFIIFNKIKNKFVGFTSFYGYEKAKNKIKINHTFFDDSATKDETNKNCKYLLLDFAFEKFEISSIEFIADSLNKKSLNEMKKTGLIAY